MLGESQHPWTLLGAGARTVNLSQATLGCVLVCLTMLVALLGASAPASAAGLGGVTFFAVLAQEFRSHLVKELFQGLAVAQRPLQLRD